MNPRWLVAAFAFGVFVACFIVHVQTKLQTVLAICPVCEVASAKQQD